MMLHILLFCVISTAKPTAEDEPDSKRAAVAIAPVVPQAPSYPQPGAAYAPQ